MKKLKKNEKLPQKKLTKETNMSNWTIKEYP